MVQLATSGVKLMCKHDPLNRNMMQMIRIRCFMSETSVASDTAISKSLFIKNGP